MVEVGDGDGDGGVYRAKRDLRVGTAKDLQLVVGLASRELKDG